MKVNLIVAVDKNSGIGLAGDIPWKDTPYGAADMAYFRKVTRGKTVIMGRRTYESIPPKFRPLPGRVNIILSSNHADSDPNPPDPLREVRLNSFSAAISWCTTNRVGEVFAIGGAAVYEEALKSPHFSTAYITTVPYDGPTDVRFPIESLKFTTAEASNADGNIYSVYKMS